MPDQHALERSATQMAQVGPVRDNGLRYVSVVYR